MLKLMRLYEFAWNEDHEGESLNLKSGKGREFSRLVGEVSDVIPEESGLYMWGRYDDKRRWLNLYVGRAGPGKTSSLRERIRKELKGDRCLFWEPIIPERTMMGHCRRHYQGREDYVRAWTRSLSRSRSTHIFWVKVTGKKSELKAIEAEVIEILNPRGNAQRPLPPAHAHVKTRGVIEKFRKQVYANRPKDKHHITV